MIKKHSYAILVIPLITIAHAQAAPSDLFDQMFEADPGNPIYGSVVSSDGSTVVGGSDDYGAHHAYRWTTALGMQDLGTLRDDSLGVSFGQFVSADGQTVVGYSDTDDGDRRGFRWNATFGKMQDLGSLRDDNLGSSSPRAVSADGNTVVGEASTNAGAMGDRAFRWTTALGKMQDLGSLRDDNLGTSQAWSVSADGKTVVGQAATNDGESFRAFRWTETLGMEDLGSLKDGGRGSSAAIGVSADGNSIAGNSSVLIEGDIQENTHAFYWNTKRQTMQDLGTLNDNYGLSYATQISADGSTVVGYSDTTSECCSQSGRAFRWTTTLGKMQDLGSLRDDNLGWSYAWAVSADGSTVVGEAATEDGFWRAFRWSEALGSMQDLGTLRDDNWGWSTANSVSADGRTIVGWAAADDGYREFIYRVPESQDLGITDPEHPELTPPETPTLTDPEGPSVTSPESPVVPPPEKPSVAEPPNPPVSRPKEPGVMQDYANVLQSFPQLASETELAAGQQQQAMNRLLDQSCFAGAPGLNCLRITGVVSNTGSDGDIGQRNQTQGFLTLGHGLSDAMTLGVTLSSGATRLHDSSINPKTAYGLSVWGEYSEHGVNRTGLQTSVGFGASTQDNNLTRGRGLSNVQKLRGSADMQTLAGHIGVGYGFAHPSGWLVTPAVAVIQQHTTLDGYSENRGAITGSYKKSHLNSTVADVGITGKRAINGVSGVSLGTGVEYDLSVDRLHLKGSTDVPGMDVNAESALDRNEVRPYVTASYHYDLPVGTVSAGVQVASDTFSDETQGTLSVSYGVKF